MSPAYALDMTNASTRRRPKGNGKSKAPHAAFGARLATLRTSAALTQVGLAHRLGVSRRQIAYYESGQGRPPGALLGRLADQFKMSTDALLGRRTSAPAELRLGRPVLSRLRAIERLGARVAPRLVATLDQFLATESRKRAR